MRRLLLCCGLGVAMAAGAATSLSAQVSGLPDTSNIPQPTMEHRDITNQDIVDKAELDATSRKRAKARAKKGNAAVPATAADIVAGSQLNDKSGVMIGTVDRVDADGVVVATTAGRVKVPLESFGKNSSGLLLAISKSEFDQMVAGTGAAPAG